MRPRETRQSASSRISPVSSSRFTRMLFVPRSLICSVASRRAPSPIDVIEMTAATPNTIPSVLRRERSLRTSKPLMPISMLSDQSRVSLPLGHRNRRRERPLRVAHDAAVAHGDRAPCVGSHFGHERYQHEPRPPPVELDYELHD